MGGPWGAPGAPLPRMRLPNPLVFLDVAVGNRNAGRLIFQLFADQLPITAENFRCLCTGETGLGYYMRPRWYKGSPFHRIIPGFMAQGGDFHRGDGYGGESIYGQFFRDEKYLYRHSKRGKRISDAAAAAAAAATAVLAISAERGAAACKKQQQHLWDGAISFCSSISSISSSSIEMLVSGCKSDIMLLPLVPFPSPCVFTHVFIY
ncbi:hypothetical protein, conserved [Eimeria brunetti]|uniref:Peptidyl-prolyl cis-trans isomerase n=1 Tax=Eimeria brunetti TaxID=51314 RepID=U6LNP1_9EIME|nr:hypothetical protein, conserved [Eimeria brunetti]